MFVTGVEAGRRGGELPIAFNAANEVAVAAFLAEEIGFGELAVVVRRTLEQFSPDEVASVGEVWEVDGRARRVARELVRDAREGATSLAAGAASPGDTE
jgi:1-deoxy-D-xylulose-5-phosphate reductoisomerase